MENLAEVEGMVASSIACGPGVGGMMGVWRRSLNVRFAERNMVACCVGLYYSTGCDNVEKTGD